MVSLLVRDWEKDVVYLIQIPRAGAAPSLSPYSLKLETWLRMAGIRYQNISNDFNHVSYKGMIPFVELNGRQMADTNYIIQELTRIYHIRLDTDLSQLSKATALALRYMIENGISWCNMYFRSINNNFFATTDGVIGHFSGFKKFVFQNFILGQRKRTLKSQCKAMGIGRDTPAEVEDALKHQLDALAVFLDSSPYLLGSKATSIDASAFAFLCMFYYFPVNKAIKNYIDESKHLVDYIRRMREEFWSDWSEATSSLSLQTKPLLQTTKNGAGHTANGQRHSTANGHDVD